MFISRITFRRDLGAVSSHLQTFRPEFDDLNNAHHLMWTFFADSRVSAKRDFLFRASSGGHSPDGDFLVVSRRQPIDSLGYWSVETKPYDPRFVTGQVLAFKLRANPTIARNGKRHDVVMDRKLVLGNVREETSAEIWEQSGREWLGARAARLGFSLLVCCAGGYRVHRIRRTKKRARVTLATLDLFGRIRVEEPEVLSAALFSGVGRGKAWGCGLLLVRPSLPKF
jgi:CRISPR system Cascade subunit CasE